MPTYFIADIGANHDGSLTRAKKLIRLAKLAGADAAKFQHFSAKTIVSDVGFKKLKNFKSHQSKWKKSVFSVYEAASINKKWTKLLKKYCDKIYITDDNPRREDPAMIRKTLIEHSFNPIEVPNRRKAIKIGISYIKKNEGILIIAGKGHEDTQTYKDKNYIFNDRVISSNYAKNL